VRLRDGAGLLTCDYAVQRSRIWLPPPPCGATVSACSRRLEEAGAVRPDGGVERVGDQLALTASTSC